MLLTLVIIFIYIVCKFWADNYSNMLDYCLISSDNSITNVTPSPPMCTKILYIFKMNWVGTKNLAFCNVYKAKSKKVVLNNFFCARCMGLPKHNGSVMLYVSWPDNPPHQEGIHYPPLGIYWIDLGGLSPGNRHQYSVHVMIIIN